MKKEDKQGVMEFGKYLGYRWTNYIGVGPSHTDRVLFEDRTTATTEEQVDQLMRSLCSSFSDVDIVALRRVAQDLDDNIIIKLNLERPYLNMYGFHTNESVGSAFNYIKRKVTNPEVVQIAMNLVQHISAFDKSVVMALGLTNPFVKIYNFKTSSLKHVFDVASSIASSKNSKKLGDRDGDPFLGFHSTNDPFAGVIFQGSTAWPKNRSNEPELEWGSFSGGIITGNFNQGWPSNIQEPASSVKVKDNKIQCAIFKSRKDDVKVSARMLEFLNKGEIINIHTHENYENIYRTIIIKTK